MRVLLLTPQPPFPARQGTAIRNWGILRHLAAEHALSLLSFAPPSAAVPAELSAACQAVAFVPIPARGPRLRLRTLFSGQADLADRLWSPAFAAALSRLLQPGQFDLVQVEGLELGRYLAAIRQAAPHTPVVYDAHNAEVTIQQRAWQNDRRQPLRWPAALYSRLQISRLARFEAGVCRQAGAVTCVSDVDAAALRALLPALRPTVIPNGLDLADYPYLPPSPLGPAAPILTFTGKMDYRPNVDAALWFANQILPLIQRHQPNARFEIVGQSPAAALTALAGRSGISIVGAVPDVRPLIARAAVYVAPLRMGGGTRFKLLEAMALGRPVVTTAIGAEGFSVQSGRELLITDDPAAFANAVLQVLADLDLARRLCLAGRAFVAAAYDWAVILPRLDSLHQQLVRPGQALRA